MSKIFDHMKGELKVRMGSYKCEIHRELHPDCKGCESLGSCAEYLLRVMDYLQVKFGMLDFPDKEQERGEENSK